MTTIAVSAVRGEMAADSQISYGNISFPATKVVNVGGTLIGVAGLLTKCSQLLRWFKGGCKEKDKPNFSDDDDVEAIILDKDGIWGMDAALVKYKIDRDIHAIGSGAASALAALMCGKSPKQAVKIACDIDPSSGLPVRIFNL